MKQRFARRPSFERLSSSGKLFEEGFFGKNLAKGRKLSAYIQELSMKAPIW